MSAQHTQGRAFLFGNGHCIGGPIAPPVDGSDTAGIAICSMARRSLEENQANARRIAAAWNACDGLSTEQVEQIKGLLPNMLPYHQLVQQRDQLLAALDEARTGLKWYQDRHPESVDGSDDEAMERIEAAIVAAGGKLGDTEEAMCAELLAWCTQHSLEHRSADDILADWDALTPEQREYLQRFIARWNALLTGEGGAA